jgi:hypothetical protein
MELMLKGFKNPNIKGVNEKWEAKTLRIKRPIKMQLSAISPNLQLAKIMQTKMPDKKLQANIIKQ